MVNTYAKQRSPKWAEVGN